MLPVAALLLVVVVLAAVTTTVSAARPSSPASSLSVPGLPPVELRGAGSQLGAFDCLTFPAAKKPQFVVVFVPGNPGMPRFYCDFARMLCDRIGAKVVLLGLVGHLEASSSAQLSSGERTRTFNLEDQVNHVAERIQPFMQEAAEHDVPFALVGHSIGSWIALRAAQKTCGHRQQQQKQQDVGSDGGVATSTRARSRASPVRRRRTSSGGSTIVASPRLLLLTPFLECPACMEAESFRSKHRLWKRPVGVLPSIGDALIEPLGALAFIAQRLPESARRWIARGSLTNLATPYDTLVVNELMHRGQVRNLLSLASDEFRTLDVQMDVASELGAMPARALYVPDDEWAPLAMAESMKSQGLHVSILESDAQTTMKHAFSVQPGSCARVAEWASNALKEMR